MKFLRLLPFALCLLPLLTGCDISPKSPSAPGGGGITGDNSVRPANLTRVSYSELPDWKQDDVRYALQAFRNSCKAKIQYAGKVIPDRALFEEKCKNLPSASADAETIRQWFEYNFQPYKVRDDAGKTSGKFTGYYSPIVNACRAQTAKCSAPVMDKPADGRNYKGVPAKDLVKNRVGRVIYWIDPIDLQDMGSATLILEDGEKVRVSVASTNDLPFNGIGSQLLKRGIRPPNGYGMKSVREYLKNNRSLANELIDNNPRYVYYTRSEQSAVTGKIGVPLSKIRSIAMDDTIYTLGMPVYVDTHLSANGQKFRRLMIAQDTGGAIKDWVRADIYFGPGDEAFSYAQGQSSTGNIYILMPKPYGK
ncbi:MAG: MltA domain-containing protein [Rickettsiales bacterium]|jgi:membrane-bound lytic murein transglycosylase A|nr:MltA domain-containing protein [Rickettsiales bacterium]